MDRRAGFEMYVLVQETELHATRAHDVTAVRSFVVSDETEDRALAGAVPSDKSDVLSGIDLQRRASQHVLSAVGLINF